MKLPDLSSTKATLPEGETFPDEQIEGELALAPDVLELMTGMPVLKRTVQERMFLRSQPELLHHFPVTGVTAEGLSVPFTAATGTIHPELEPANYLVTYQVGHDPDNLPAIMAQAILHLVRYRLLKFEEDREEASAAISVMRLGMNKLRRERDG